MRPPVHDRRQRREVDCSILAEREVGGSVSVQPCDDGMITVDVARDAAGEQMSIRGGGREVHNDLLVSTRWDGEDTIVGEGGVDGACAEQAAVRADGDHRGCSVGCLCGDASFPLSVSWLADLESLLPLTVEMRVGEEVSRLGMGRKSNSDPFLTSVALRQRDAGAANGPTLVLGYSLRCDPVRVNCMSESTSNPIHPGARIGHVHLKVADLQRAIDFYHGVLGFEVTQKYGASSAFLSAGGYHHHIGLNTWESLGGIDTGRRRRALSSSDPVSDAGGAGRRAGAADQSAGFRSRGLRIMG